MVFELPNTAAKNGVAKWLAARQALGWIWSCLSEQSVASWWRLDGYDTCNEGSGANAEEPTVVGMMELSLSNSDESSAESESGYFLVWRMVISISVHNYYCGVTKWRY